MSLRLMNIVWKSPLGDPQAKLILLKLADYADKDGICWPSLSTISTETELHKATVCRKIDKLESDGLIRRERFKNGCKYDLSALEKLSQPATPTNGKAVAQSDSMEDESCRTQRPVAQCDLSQPATFPVAHSDSTCRTVRLSNTREPSRTTSEPQQQQSAPAIHDNWGDDDVWTDPRSMRNGSDIDALKSRINALHPSWKKRPHFTGKELQALHTNLVPWTSTEDDDWTLLKAYMDAIIPADWKENPRDFLQPDNRLGLLGVGPTTLLGLADRWARECKRRGVATGIEAQAKAERSEA